MKLPHKSLQVIFLMHFLERRSGGVVGGCLLKYIHRCDDISITLMMCAAGVQYLLTSSISKTSSRSSVFFWIKFHRSAIDPTKFSKAPNPYPWLPMTCDFILRSHVIKLNKFPADVTAKSEQKKRQIKTLKSFIFISSRILFFLRKKQTKEEKFHFVLRKLFQSSRALSV